MKIRTLAGLLGLFATVFIAPMRAAGPVNCACVENLPSLIVSNCPALVPDLCSLATNCFTTNVVIGGPNYCLQVPPPGTPASAGTNYIMFTVTDSQTNQVTCPVPFIVIQSPNPVLTLLGASNKTAECGSGWQFDPPTIVSTCCDSSQALNVVSTKTNGVCPPIVTRIWEITNICGLSATCTQVVTVVDTLPPATLCSGVNYVPNGNLESYTTCPTSSSQFDLAAPWFTPTGATSDYYNTCSGVGSYAGVPTNAVGVQSPLSGRGYGGIFTWSTFGNHPTNSYREYMEVPLLWPLAAGQTYSVSFYVSRAERYGNAMAEIGAHFSAGSVTSNFTYWGVLPVTPQVVNPSTNILLSTNAWMLVTGTFTAAGGEDHLTIGNFLSDPASTAVPAPGPFINYAYYYVDEVSVQLVCPPAVTNASVACGMPPLFTPPVFYDQCSGTNVNVTLSTLTNGICPKIITRTWTGADLCNNSAAWSQSITNLDNTPPIPVCNGPNLVPNPGFDNFMTCPTNFSQLDIAYPWNRASDATPDYFNTCATGLIGVPTNNFGAQTPFNGPGYAGLYAYAASGETIATNCYREYIQVQLQFPLVAGQTYPVSFRVSPGDHCGWAIAELGAHFSVGSISNGIVGVLNAVPQVVNPSTNLLTATNSWTLISGAYTAFGGETHLTIGCFLTDAVATATPILVNATNLANPLNDVAYYYIDDVYVGGPCSIAPLVMIPCGTPVTFPTVTGFDGCSGNVPVVISTLTNSICPLSVKRTWTLTDLCGNSTNVSQTMGALADTEPPMPICIGTNLVPNPSFETYTNCPYNYSQLNYAVPWYSPGSGTSDYFNTCDPMWIPVNIFGSRYPFTGQAYAGAYLHYQVLEYREYLQTPLTMPMVAGQTYTVSFRVSLAEISDVAISQIGAHFSVNPVTSTNYFPLNVVPQVVNAATNFLTSTNGWMLVAGNYTAIGGEAYLTLGNFLSNNVTAFTNVSGNPGEWSYYYFDDVRVTPATVCLPQEIIAPCGQPLPFTPVTAYDNCSGTNVTTTIIDTTNSTCPLIVTRAWTFTDLCGNSTNVSQQVFITDNQPPVVNCACLLSNAQPLLFTNACHGVIPDLAFLTNSGCATDNCGPVQIFQSPAPGTIVNPGSHPITLTFSDCSGNSTNCAVTYNVLSPPVAIFTPPDIFVLTCSNSAVVNFDLNYFGIFGVITCTPPSGSAFPLGTNVVTCIGTTSCGDPFTNTFKVIARSARVNKWSCMSFVIGIPYEIIKYSGGSGSAARMVNIPDFPGGGMGANFENFATDGQDGPRFNFGAAEKFTFSTELDFNATNGAGFDLLVPPGSGETSGTTLLRFRQAGGPQPAWHVTRPVSNPESPLALYRSIAIGTNGELFSSFTSAAAELNTNVLLNLAPMNGATSVVMTITLDCRTREVMLDFPFCAWTPDVARKGWDGCIYGNGPRGGSKTNKTARFILTPLTTTLPVAITNLDLIVTNLPVVHFDNPSLNALGRKWGDGHVTLMKAYDDGAERALDFTSLGQGGGVKADLGHAADVSFRTHHFETGDVPTQEQFYNLIDSRLFTNSIRIAQTVGGIGCAADFTQWGVSNVTVQLWNGATLVAETNHVPATLSSTLVNLGGFPSSFSCSGNGVVSLADTNPIIVLSGLSCGSGGCVGTELRITAELSGAVAPPSAFIGLECLISEGMDLRLSQLQTTPACTPTPINASRDAAGLHLNWSGDGFRLQGAESLNGPWYDLGVSPPVTLPASSSLRLFRLRCD